LIVGAEYRNRVAIEEVFEALPDAVVDPVHVKIVVNSRHGAGRPRHAFQVMQYAFGVIADRALDQKLLVVGGDFIRALCGTEHAAGSAYDGHGDNDTDRDEQTGARFIPARWVRLPGGLHVRRRQHILPWGRSGWSED